MSYAHCSFKKPHSQTPGQVKAGTNTPWPPRANVWSRELAAVNQTLHIRPVGAGRGKRELVTWPLHVWLAVPLGKEEGRRRSILMASYRQLWSCPGQWAIRRSKCWWLGRHSGLRPLDSSEPTEPPQQHQPPAAFPNHAHNKLPKSATISPLGLNFHPH